MNTRRRDRIRELEAERDALLAEDAHYEARQMALDELRAENAALRAALRIALENALHAAGCSSYRAACSIPEHGNQRCDCWKLQPLQLIADR